MTMEEIRMRCVNYKSNGNELCEKSLELKKFSDVVYYHYNNDNVTRVFAKVGDKCYYIDNFLYCTEKHLQTVADRLKCEDDVKRLLLGKIERGSYINLIWMAIASYFGLYDKALAVRERRIRAIEAEQAAENARRAAEWKAAKELEKKAEEDRLWKAEADFKDSQPILVTDFVAIAERHGMKVSIRTKGQAKKLSRINRKGCVWFNRGNFKRVPNVDTLQGLALQLAEVI